MPRGGFRVGAGRKKEPKSGVVLGMDGNRRVGAPVSVPAAPALTDEEQASLLEPPADLKSERARGFWTFAAPHAIRQRTLTQAEVPGFRQLCTQWAFIEDLVVRLDLLGPATKDADAAMKSYVRLSQRLDASLARFKLTAFGKPAVAEKPKAAANPWGAIAPGVAPGR